MLFRSRATGGAEGDNPVVDQVRALREEMAALQATMARVAESSETTSTTLRLVAGGGASFKVES